MLMPDPSGGFGFGGEPFRPVLMFVVRHSTAVLIGAIAVYAVASIAEARIKKS